MSTTPKTTFFLTNGTKLVDVYPLESNGPATISGVNVSGGPNQSMPNEIVDIDYTDSTIKVFGDLTERFVAFSSTKFTGTPATRRPDGSFTQTLTFTGAQDDWSGLVQQGLAAGMFVEMLQQPGDVIDPVPPRTYVKSVDVAGKTITLSEPVGVAVTASRSVRFCFPFNVVDLDPSTPSPYVGEYGATSCTLTPDGRATLIKISPQTPLIMSSFDIVGVTTGNFGTWVVQGLSNGADVFYPGSKFRVSGNSYAPANKQYTVGNAFQSQTYNVTAITVTGSSTTITIQGNVGPFFVPSQQLIVTGNTTHDVGTRPLNGSHTIASVAYTALTDSTDVTINAAVTGVSGPANGHIRPAIVTTLVSVTDFIDSLANAANGIFGVVTAGAPIELAFVAPPAITPSATSPAMFTVSWRVAGDQTAVFTKGRAITIKGNNFYPFKRLVVDSAVHHPSITVLGPDGTPNTQYNITEVRTVVTEPTSIVGKIGMSGKIIFPSPAVPYGHVQYSVLTPSTSLQLVGRGVTHYNMTTTWGQAIQNNQLHQLENFAARTAPPAPLNGQFWFDTSVPGMNVYNSGNWYNVLVAGMPAQADLDMNNHTIYGLRDIDEGRYGPSQAVNLGSADERYVNVTGDEMSGALDMANNAITGLADTVIPEGTTIDTDTPNGQDALNVRTADARYVNVDGDTMIGELDMSDNRITNVKDPARAQDAATKSYVDSLTSGIVWLQPVLDPNLFDDTLAIPPVISDASMLFYRSYVVKPIRYNIVGANDANRVWHIPGDNSDTIVPGQKITVTGNTTAAANKTYTVQSVSVVTNEISETETRVDTHITVVEPIPSLTTYSGLLYHAGGAWNNLHGHVMSWNGTEWVDVLERPVKVGDRFGVYFEVDNDEVGVPTPGGSFGVGSTLGGPGRTASGKIVTVNAVDDDFKIDWGTSAGATYPPHTPMEPDAVSVLGVNSSHYGHSYTFRGQWGTGAYALDYKWIEFAGPAMLVDGAGLRYTGNILNVGQGTGIIVNANSVSVNAAWLTGNYMRRDGAVPFTNDISMGSFRLKDLKDPTSPQDAVTLKYLMDNTLGSSGDKMTGELDMGNNKIVNVPTPTAGTDAANKEYTDTKVTKSGDTMTGTLLMSSATGTARLDMGGTNKIVNLADATDPTDAINLRTADGRYINTSGDTMTGFLSLHASPTQPSHASTKQYVDEAVSGLASAVTSGTVDGGSY